MSKPKSNANITMRLPSQLKEKIDVVSHQVGWNQSKFIKYALELAFQSPEVKELIRIQDLKREVLGVQL